MATGNGVGMGKQQWDGGQWWDWDGSQWQLADPQPPAPPADSDDDTANKPAPGAVPAPAPPGRSRTGWIVGAVVAILLLAGGGAFALTRGSDAPVPTSRTVTGTFTNSKALGTVGGSATSNAEHLSQLIAGKTFDCADGGEYPTRYKAGDTIVIADQSGTVIGTGHLEGGTQDLKGCHFRFTVTVPEASSYQVSLGGLDSYIISSADLAAKNWTLDLSV